MRVRAGTSGYSYKSWKGPFYPDKLKDADMLGFYAQKLPTVEINNTFYRLPKTSVLESWAQQVPDDFVFVIKASQRITHMKRLRECDEPLGYLLETTAALGPKLGPLLFQLPPNAKKDTERLRAFLPLLGGRRAAFEFRHESWQCDEVFAVLGDAGAALCIADTEAGTTPMTETAPFGYLRLRKPSYDKRALTRWLERIKNTRWSEVFVFFKHDEGVSPQLATRFQALCAEKS